jgi:hypothetical protein
MTGGNADPGWLDPTGAAPRAAKRTIIDLRSANDF